MNHTLSDAYYNILNVKLTGKYFIEHEYEGETFVKMANRLNKYLLNIRAAIKKHGKTFEIPTSDSDIPVGSEELFAGCINWI